MNEEDRQLLETAKSRISWLVANGYLPDGDFDKQVRMMVTNKRVDLYIEPEINLANQSDNLL